jgi:hypothetical protein
MSYFTVPTATDEFYEIKGISGRRPTDKGFEYLIDWWLPDGSIETSIELAAFLESSDPDTWLPLLDAFDTRYPDSDAVIGDWNW